MKRNRKLEAEVLAYLEVYNDDARQNGLSAVMSRTSPDFLGFGTGAHERYDGRDELLAGLKRDNSEVDNIERVYRWIRVTERGPLIIFATQYEFHWTAGGHTSVLPARLTGVLERYRGHLRRVQTHMSFPASEQPEGRSWPTPIEVIAVAVGEERPDLRAQAAPDGTVTLLFTDIEDSTGMMERLGDTRWLDLLRTHNAIVRDQAHANGCFEVKSQGDGFMIASQSARRGLQCAIDVQRAFARYNEMAQQPFWVRIGLHTGEVLTDAEDFFGKHVTLASRIAGEARGGQILVSSLLKDLTESAGDLSFDKGREVQLRGLSGSYRIHEVRWQEGENKPHAGAKPAYLSLSPREIEVLRLIAKGYTNLEISSELTLSLRTVARHVTNIYGKIGARSKSDATAYAIRHHLTPD